MTEDASDLVRKPPVPTGLRAHLPVFATSPTVSLTWNSEAAANRYGVHRDGILLKVVTTSSYTDATVLPGHTYSYEVDARNSAGTSAPSAPVSISVPSNVTIPPVPTGLAAGNVTAASCALTWQPSPGATSYIVSEDGVAFGTVTGTALNVTGLSPQTTYSFTVLATNSAGSSAQSAPISVTTPAVGAGRNPLLWPFLSTAYPNLPVGSGAVRVAANLIPSTIQSLHADISVILMDPAQPLTKILPNGGFSSDRCVATSQTPVATVPMAPSFVVPNTGHNYSTASVNADGKTYVQGGSFGRCVAGQPATLGHLIPGGNLYGTALGTGGRGGTDMDSLAGTIRLGELVPGGAIRHAVALDIDNLANSQNKWVWPATKKDSYSYNGTNPYAVPGALFVLPLDFNIASLRTVPGRILAQAFHDYGGYCGNDTKGPSIALCTEWSERGDVQSEFAAAYGFPFAGSGTSSPWIQDVTEIFAALEVVINNGPTSIGGGGTPIVALSPPLL